VPYLKAISVAKLSQILWFGAPRVHLWAKADSPYQRDSSSKRPRASVVSAARSPTRRSTTSRTRPPLGWMRLCQQADACSATAKPPSKDRGWQRVIPQQHDARSPRRWL